MRGAGRLLGVVLLGIVPGLASAQSHQVGSEFQVNTYTTGRQNTAAVAAHPNGAFVVVWQSKDQDGSATGVFGQRFANNGAALGSEFQVNTYTTDYQAEPAIATDPSGGFVVVWQSGAQDGSIQSIFGQRYASGSTALGSEFQVNTYTTDRQKIPSVAADRNGGFVVVWTSFTQDGDGYGIFAQRYASSGALLGSEFQVNTYTMDSQYKPVVATEMSGGFIVVWESFMQDGAFSGVFGQRYASSGARLGSEFQVNTYTTSAQGDPTVATNASGGFVILWGSIGQDGGDDGIFGQRYTSGGARLGSEFQVNTHTLDAQKVPAVATDPSGGFVVVWESDKQEGSEYGVFAQRYASNGARLGSEFQVNTYTTSYQESPAVAADARGNFVVAWESYKQDGSNDGVFAQRFAEPPRAVAPVMSPGMLLMAAGVLGIMGVASLRRRRTVSGPPRH